MQLGIYGAGGFGKVLFEILKKRGIKVDFFIDQYKKEKKLFGLPIYRLNEAPKDAKILVSIPQYPLEIPPELERYLVYFYPPSKKALEQLGFEKVFTFEDLIMEFPEYLTLLWERFYKYRQKTVDMETKRQLETLFSDERSLETLESIIRFRENPVLQNYPFPDRDFQYFPFFVREFFKKKNIHFADLGAYKGDTIAILLHLFGKNVKTLTVFEPVKEHLEALKGVLKEITLNGLVSYLYPAGVWRETTIKRVKLLGPSTFINDEEGTPVPLVRLDDTLIGSPINFLKMDIEGSELDALKGGIEFINENKPLMAISVYHHPDDLWEIPLFIEKNFPFYRFYLRLHGHMLNEIVLYCIPNNK